MTEYTAKKVYIKDAAGNYAVPYVNPADTNNLGVVKPDGATITTAADGTISTNNGNLRALTAYANEGELLQDPDGLAFVEKYNKSTFDASKFTKVGSPNITEDGIASGFSAGKYLKLPSDVTLGTDFELYLPFTCNRKTAQSGDSQMYRAISDSAFRILLNQYSGGYIGFNMSDGTNSLGTPTIIPASDLVVGDKYIIVVKQKNETCTYGYIHNGTYIEVGTKTNYPLNMPSINTFYIGRGADVGYSGSIDLKQFSITIDGVEVFSGNKTGIDTIKSDDYTVVGTPTISADGIASGFSSSNYITFFLSQQYTNGLEIIFPDFLTPNVLVTSGEQEIVSLLDYKYGLKLTEGILRFQINQTISDTTYKYNFDANYSTNTWYSAKAIINNNSASFYIKEKGMNSWTLVRTQPLTKTLVNTGTWYIGNRHDLLNSAYFNGSIDLNAFKIYVDGNLVYQPCLKIPYTESKTGSKIVNFIYRDRVNDMAEQFGYANYYTLQDEAKGNYTVVGSPTISSDFVASGFSTSNYIITSYTLSKGKSYKFTYSYIGHVNENASGSYCLFEMLTSGAYTGDSIRFFQGTNNIIRFSGGSIASDINTTVTVTDNAIYNFIIETDFTTYIKVSETTTGYSNTVATTFEHSTNGECSIYLGRRSSSTSNAPLLLGSIDLKEFKIYVDNKLAYEAVIDPNFTLPQVELYGLIGQRTLRDSYRNGINYWELYSNRDLEQGGSCTSGVEVTLPKPFADTNYVLSVPYSAKSATAFTPTQTGDWIAKGKGLL